MLVSPALLERFKIQDELGRGGMGVVYRAHQISLDRPVALKILGASVSAVDDFRSRFIVEARLAAKLSHPNVVKVLDFDILEDDTTFIAYELVEGRTMAQRIEDGRIPATQARLWAAGLLDGLAALHEVGVIHRDLKPANVMITSAGTAMLLDLGIARELADTHQRTATGVILGTPDYLSPEQIECGALTPACDVYSAGALFYELACGRPPFTGNSPTDLLLAHVTAKPRPPQTVSVHADPLLSALAMEALEKDPARRPTIFSMRSRLADLPISDPPIDFGNRKTLPSSSLSSTEVSQSGGLKKTQMDVSGLGRSASRRSKDSSDSTQLVSRPGINVVAAPSPRNLRLVGLAAATAVAVFAIVSSVLGPPTPTSPQIQVSAVASAAPTRPAPAPAEVVPLPTGPIPAEFTRRWPWVAHLIAGKKVGAKLDPATHERLREVMGCELGKDVGAWKTFAILGAWLESPEGTPPPDLVKLFDPDPMVAALVIEYVSKIDLTVSNRELMATATRLLWANSRIWIGWLIMGWQLHLEKRTDLAIRMFRVGLGKPWGREATTTVHIPAPLWTILAHALKLTPGHDLVTEFTARMAVDSQLEKPLSGLRACLGPDLKTYAQVLEELAKVPGEGPAALAHLGATYKLHGRLDEARATWKRGFLLKGDLIDLIRAVVEDNGPRGMTDEMRELAATRPRSEYSKAMVWMASLLDDPRSVDPKPGNVIQSLLVRSNTTLECLLLVERGDLKRATALYDQAPNRYTDVYWHRVGISMLASGLDPGASSLAPGAQYPGGEDPFELLWRLSAGALATPQGVPHFETWLLQEVPSPQHKRFVALCKAAWLSRRRMFGPSLDAYASVVRQGMPWSDFGALLSFEILARPLLADRVGPPQEKRVITLARSFNLPPSYSGMQLCLKHLRAGRLDEALRLSRVLIDTHPFNVEPKLVESWIARAAAAPDQDKYVRRARASARSVYEPWIIPHLGEP